MVVPIVPDEARDVRHGVAVSNGGNLFERGARGMSPLT